MKLKAFARTAERKKESKRIRRDGSIPAVIYVRGKTCETITVDSAEFNGLLRKVLPGRLSTTIFTITDENGKNRNVIVKEIQYKPTNYEVQHLDFEELIDDTKVNIKVPIECTGAADSPGIKLGGVLRQVIRQVRVRCLPKDIPSAFRLDVASLDMRGSRRLKDLEIPEGVRALADLNEVAVTIVKR